MKKLIVIALSVFAVSPALAADGSWMDPYLAMRVSYIFLDVSGGQDVYLAPGGVLGPKIADERFNIDRGHGFGAKFAFGGDANIPRIFGRLRIEAEYANNGSFVIPVASEGGEITFEAQNTTIFGNAYYSVNTGSWWAPYIGAGAGVSHFTANVGFSSGSFNAQMSSSEYKFGWQVGAGLSMNLTRGVMVDLGYRFSDLGKFVSDIDIHQWAAPGTNVTNSIVMRNNVDMNFKSHEIVLGIRYML